MILIKNIAIVTQNKRRQIINRGAIVIESDIIEALGSNQTIEKKYRRRAKKIIDGQGKIALPGLINAHTHLAMTLLRGYADDLPLEKWWFNHIYPAESKFTPKHVYWGSLLGTLEMIKSGTTCFTDFYYFQDQVAQASRRIGIRTVLGQAGLETPNFEFKTLDQAIEITQKLIKKYQNKDLIRVSLSPHMFQTISLDGYRKLKKIACQHNLILSTHLAETKQEVNYCLSKYKKSPVQVLSREGILDKKTLLAHCCWLTKKEIKVLSQLKASVVHCPISNMKLASGIMPLSEMLKAGINVCLGTDGACSNNNLDMFEEMKTAALLHKVSQLEPTVAGAQTILDMATINGAKALGLDKEIGSLEPGKKADLIIVDFEKPHLTPCHNIVSHLVYAVQGSDVETVVINGRIIMGKRRIKKINEKNILKRVKNLSYLEKGDMLDL